MPVRFARLRHLVSEHQFASFVILCILVATAMTLISLELYRRSGAIKLDMSRPGYEKVRQEVEKSQDDQPYSSSGVLDSAAVKDFDSRLDKYREELKKLSDYNSADIADEDLNLIDHNGQAQDNHADQAPQADN